MRKVPNFLDPLFMVLYADSSPLSTRSMALGNQQRVVLTRLCPSFRGWIGNPTLGGQAHRRRPGLVARQLWRWSSACTAQVRAAPARVVNTHTAISEIPIQAVRSLPIEEYRRAFNKGCKQIAIEGLVPHALPLTRVAGHLGG
jgi:hypothetical protein